MIIKEVKIINITLYTTNCPKCKILKQKLNDKNITYDICEDIDIMISKRIMSAPVLEVNGELMNYLNAVDWVKGI